jgi:hypothetical protein
MFAVTNKTETMKMFLGKGDEANLTLKRKI